MHLSKAIMPLQPLSIFTFFLLFLPPVLSTGQVAKPGCKDRCGNFSIPYPFGVGSECSLDPSFTLTCNTSTDPPTPYLSVLDKEVIEINETFIRVKYPNLVSVCYDLSVQTGINATTAASYKQSMTVNLSGTPYSLSRENRLTAIGCDDIVLGIGQSEGTPALGIRKSNGTSSVLGGCSAVCLDKNIDSSGIGYCSNNETSPGNGCCQAIISDGKTFLRAQLVDLSIKLFQHRRRLFPCSYAFIQETVDSNETVFSYPLYYLNNSTAFLNDNWASTTRPPLVRLDWLINGAENCSQAQLNNNSYACQDKRSVCVDVPGGYNFPTGIGYRCNCVPGYEGNPYLRQGCQPISFSHSTGKSGCPDQCGKLSIPFPFGIGPNCYKEPSFEIICNNSGNPPTPYLSILNRKIIELNSSYVIVYDTNQPGLVCYNLSDTNQHRMGKTKEHSFIIDLSGTQYTLSEENSIIAIGSGDMVVANFGQSNVSSIGSSCATISSDRRKAPPSGSFFDDLPTCPSANTEYWPGDGCCTAPVHRGTSYVEANLIDVRGEWPNMPVSCSYTFVHYKNEGSYLPSFMNESTEIPGYWEDRSLWLDWRIGEVNCKEAERNKSSYACVDINSHCVDFNATLGGYVCNCSEGYQGNPYLISGCQDINECADNTTNLCNSNSVCVNTAGSFKCLCPKGYNGDGRKDGKGCFSEPQTKIIILIGMGSGLGFLLLLLMLFWLFKLFQERKDKFLKERFFKRNGGLLLRQQTNEGVLGKTKVFPVNDLKIATDSFNASRIIGQGGQGTVYKGMLSDGKIVAIKKSKLLEENQLEQFINEVVILSQINHRNVVKLLGCCLETEVPLLVYEFMPNGTLFDLIHDLNNEFSFPWFMRLKIAADIAGALAYLHSASSIPIYHRDIKSSNILLDEKQVVKVSDFGTSRLVAKDQTHLTTMVKGTFGYLDPEYFQSSQLTEKSDVYSFGVVLVELLTRQRPISLDNTYEERGLAFRFFTSIEEDNLDTILDHQVLEQCKKEDVILVAKLAGRCLNLEGRMRPTMKEVATELESFKKCQISGGAIDEFEEGIYVEDHTTMNSDIEYTATTSYKSGYISSTEHSLMLTTK